jgi:DNA repair protein RecN (Recombination protein N)
MLEELQIQNYALIDDLKIDFNRGLTVLTGETGAGKSILVGALSLILGEKAGAEIIRTGAEETNVAAIINITGLSEIQRWLIERDITTEEDSLIIRRKLKKNGRGTINVNSQPISRRELQDLASLIFDLHGQHQHQSLLHTENHMRLLDRYADAGTDVAGLKKSFSILSSLNKELEDLLTGEKEYYREKEILEFAVQEIKAANLTSDEEESLIKERKILNASEKLNALLEEFYANALANRSGALLGLQLAKQALSGIVEIDNTLGTAVSRLDEVFYELEDIAETVKQYGQGIEFSPDRLEQCEDRLAVIHRLQKKYGNRIEDILEYAAKSKQKLEGMENFEADKEGLQQRIEELEGSVLDLAHRLSSLRKKAAIQLEKDIEHILEDLSMPKVSFKVGLARKESKNGKPLCGPSGFDLIEFLFSPNPGEPLKPLKAIASGGEISRVMLAIKSVLAESDNIPCLVFDEIDAGIGGEVGVALGNYLSELSKLKQVLSITHLAPIAVRAHNHIKVEKKIVENTTITDIEYITGNDRTVEVARMLAGDKTGGASLSHAQELLSGVTSRNKKE